MSSSVTRISKNVFLHDAPAQEEPEEVTEE